MTKIELVKALIKAHIRNHRPMVVLGCAEEVEAYQAYLEQLRDEFMAMPMDVLEGKVKGLKEVA